MIEARRQYLRSALALPFSLHIDEHQFFGNSYNISMSGICVSVTVGDVSKIGLGLTGKCQISLGEVNITLSCQILRIYQSELALQFVDLRPEQINLLQALIICGSKTQNIVVTPQQIHFNERDLDQVSYD